MYSQSYNYAGYGGTAANGNAASRQGQQLIDMEKPGAGMPLSGKSTRKRFNIVAILLATFVPWLIFLGVAATLSFNLHFKFPFMAWCIVVLHLVLVAYLFYRAKDELLLRTGLSWYTFIAVTAAVAWILGLIVGDYIYTVHTKRAYDVQTLNAYPGVDPSAVSGEQVMDAGRLLFADGARLDFTKAMAFKSDKLYCVAPVINPNAQPASYDFWAVGIDCCSGTQTDFHCGEYNNPMAAGGVRLMDDKARPFYRLAVQQAEAMYHIQAQHPLFFRWVQDPIIYVQNFKDDAYKLFDIWIWCFLLGQAFLVVCACLYFSKHA